MGQNGAETHLGTIRVPIDLHTNKCLITRGTRDTGGTSQLFSPAQSKQKASTPSESGFQKREKNLGNLRLWEWAKRSTECGPQMLSTWWKNSNETPQSSKSTILLMASACSLRDLGIQSTCKSIPFRKTSRKIEREISCKSRFILPLRIMDGMLRLSVNH